MPKVSPRGGPALIALVAAYLCASTVLAQSTGLPSFVHPRDVGLDYCMTRDVRAVFDAGTGEYTRVPVDGTCESTVGFIDPNVLGVLDTLVLPADCEDGKRNLGEFGIDCGGLCDAECVDCIDPWTTIYLPVSVPTQTDEQTGPRLLQLADGELSIRAYDTLFEFADEQGVAVTDLDTSDELLSADARYVDDHMQWQSDSSVNEPCINDEHGLSYDPGWDFPVPASYSVNYTGLPACSSCSKDFCGDCEDHAILRQALAKRIGVSSQCVWDAIDLNSPGLHEYNVVLYQSKYRLMDYGTIDAWLATHTWNAHETENNWNYVYGPRYPDTGNLAEDYTYNYPLSGPSATSSKVDCPEPWDFNTYYEDTCP